MASRKLIIMNGSDQIGGLRAFLRVFSCAGVIVLTGCLNGCQLLTVITGSSTQTELTTISSQSMMRSGA